MSVPRPAPAAATTVVAGLAATLVAVSPPAAAARGRSVACSAPSQWPGGCTAGGTGNPSPAEFGPKPDAGHADVAVKDPSVIRHGGKYLDRAAIGGGYRTAPGITGPWTALAGSERNPFSRANNVTFPGGAWTRDISHGEPVRTNPDQAMEISPCKPSCLYQGLDPNASGEDNLLHWRLGLLTQTNSPC